MPDVFDQIDKEKDIFDQIENEPVESTPLDDRPPRADFTEPIPRPRITGEIPEVGGGIPPQLTEADLAEARKQSRLGEEIAGTMAEAEMTGRAARIFEPNLPRNLLAPTTEEAVREGEAFRASIPPELQLPQPSFRPPISPETRESLAAGEALSGTLSDLSSADQALVLGGAVASGGLPGAAGRILGAAAPATFGVEGLKSIYEGAKTLLSDEATPEERGQAKVQIGLGASMLPGLGAVLKRPTIPPRIVETIAKAESTGALSKSVAAAKAVTVEEVLSPLKQTPFDTSGMSPAELLRHEKFIEGTFGEKPIEVETVTKGETPRGAEVVELPSLAPDAFKAGDAVDFSDSGAQLRGTIVSTGPDFVIVEDVNGNRTRVSGRQTIPVTKGEPNAIQEPSATKGVLRQERSEVGLQEVRQPQVEAPIPREPARGQGGEESQVLLAERVAAMGPDEFAAATRGEFKEGGFTTHALNMGKEMATPEGIAELRVLEARAKAEFDAAFEADNMDTIGPLSAQKQFFTEALEAATGASEFKQSDPVKFREIMEAARKPDEKAIPAATEATPATAADQTPIPAGQASVVEPGVGAVPQDVSGAGAAKFVWKGEDLGQQPVIAFRQRDGTILADPSARIHATAGANMGLGSTTASPLEPGFVVGKQFIPGSQAGNMAPVRAAQAAAREIAQPAEVGPGMGGALKSETPDPRAQLAQLTDSIATLAAEGKTRPAEAFSLGETLSKAKDRATAALDGLKAAGSYMKLKLEGKPVATEYKGVLGDRHLALSESSVNARKWVKSVLKAVPDPKVREAISNWVDAGGDAATLSKAAGETKPRYREGYERAQKLTPEERTVAENLKNYFDSRLQEAIDAGVLEDGIENYIHRIYEQDSPWKKGVIQELRSGLFTGKPALAKQRVFEYDFEAEKAGKRPIKDFAKRVVAYDLALNKAIADRAAVKGMMEIKMGDGRPMIDVGGGGKVIENAAGEPQATIINRSAKKIDPNDAKANRGDYKPFDHPALRKWKWATEDTAGKPVFVQGDVLIHPEAIGDIQKLLGRSAIRQNPIGRAALGVSSTIKQTMLDLSGFHPVQIAVHGTEHRTFAPVKEIDFTNPDVRGLIRGGAAVGETSGHAAFSEGLSGGSGSLTKHIPWVGERLQAYNSWLFEDYIPRLKVAMGLHALERNRSRFKDLSPDQQYELTANQMNAAFGEQNYTMLGRSKTTQDALRLVLLAPDFLEARSRFVAQAFTKYGAEQRQALLLGAATMYITARLINKMLDDEYHFEPKNAFNVVYGGKSYGLRTVQGDLIHAVTEPGKFINHRLNPVFGKPALEFVTGRDYFGRKRTVTEQLEDFAKTPVPIGVRGAFENQEQTLFESFLNSFGLVTKRDSASSDMSQLAQKWKEKNKISTGPGEFIYDADKDPFRDIKLAAERGDEAGVRSEVAKAMNAGMKRSRILEHFKLSAMHHFAGSTANEKKFVESLTEDQKKIYRDAVAERKRIRETVRRAGFTP